MKLPLNSTAGLAPQPGPTATIFTKTFSHHHAASGACEFIRTDCRGGDKTPGGGQ